MAGILIDSVERRLAVPFEWGVADCCLAVCDVLVDLGWPDPAQAYRGRYTTQAGAEHLMRGGVEGVAECECARLGWPEIDPDDALPGDVGVVAKTLAIRLPDVWAVKSETGWALKERVRRAWRPQ